MFGFWFAGVVSAALVLLALRALLCVALRCSALPCVRFVCSGRDELIVRPVLISTLYLMYLVSSFGATTVRVHAVRAAPVGRLRRPQAAGLQPLK